MNLVCLAAILPSSAAFGATEPLARAAAIRNLLPARAAQAVPIRLKGVVTALSGWKNSFFFQDESGGISVDRRGGGAFPQSASEPVAQGDEVEIVGVSGAGLFAPVVTAVQVRVIGRGSMPLSRLYSWNELSLGDLDSHWIALQGVIRGARVADNWGRPTLFLDLQTPGGPIQLLVHDFPIPSEFERLVGARVIVHGVCGTIFNDRRQFLGLRLFVPSLSFLNVERYSPADPFAAPSIPLGQLLRFGSGSRSGRRIVVVGTVTHAGSERLFHLQESDSAISVSTSKPLKLMVGSRVQASGFIGVGADSHGLEDAVVRNLPVATPVQPARVNASDLISFKDGFTFAPYAGRLVDLDATLIDVVEGPRRLKLLLRNGETSFQADLQSDTKPNVARVGNILRLTGVCDVEFGTGGVPRSITILLRSPADLKVLAKPFWTLETASWLVAALLAVIAAILVWSMKLGKALPVETGVDDALGARSERIGRLLGVSAASMGLAIFVGWVAGIEKLAVLVPGFAPTVPNTALACMCLGFAIYFGRSDPSSRPGRAIVRAFGIACCLLALSIGTVGAIESSGGCDLGFGRFFAARSGFPQSVLGSPPGYVANTSALNIVLLALALLFHYLHRFFGIAQLLLISSALNCLFQITRLVYGRDTFLFASRFGMALPSIVMFLLICLGAFLSRPNHGVMRIIASRAPGGILARRLLPAALIIPCAVGWVRWQGELRGYYNTQVGLMMYSSALVIVFASLILLTSSVLNRMDRVRSRAEENLKKSQGRLQQMAEAMPQIVWTALPSGEKDYCNRRWFEYTSFARDVPLGIGLAATVHPEDLAALDRRWVLALAAREPFTAEVRLKNAAGRYRWHLKTAVPILAASGEVDRWIGTYTEVEDYKRIQEALRRLNQDLEARVRDRTVQMAAANARLEQTYTQLTSIMDATTQVAIVMVDRERVIRMFNRGAEKMFGYAAAEVVGIAKSDILLDPLEVSERLVALSRKLGGPATRQDLFINPALRGEVDFQEWNHVRKDGALVPVAIGVTAVRDSAGNVAGFLGIATDISKLKNMELALRRNNYNLTEQTVRAEMANRAKDQFLATMSHEIRTPMNAILGISDMLAETVLDAEQRNYVEICRRAGSALMSLINDLLDLSKIEAGHLELEEIEFNLEDVLDQAMELTAANAQAKKLILALRTGPDLPTSVIGDPARLRQILLNLMGNAIKFTESGEVVLAASHDGGDDSGFGTIAFSVSDTGIGIPANKLETIFEDFKQADASTTRKYGGTGLGLGIGRKLVERMGGRLTVESVVGKGSTFRFAVSFELPAGSEAVGGSRPGRLRGKSALVLDANQTTRAILAATVSRWGMECLDFGRPGDALVSLQARLTQSVPVDVILIDCHADETNGIDVAKCMGSVAPGAPIVLITSDAAASDLAPRKEARLAGHAVAPVRKSHLFRLVSGAIGFTGGADPPHPRAGEPAYDSHFAVRPLRILVAEDVRDNRLLVTAYLKDRPYELIFVEDGSQAVAAFRDGVFDLVLMDMLMPVMDGLSATMSIREFERSAGRIPTPVVAFSANASAADIKKSIDAGCQAHVSKPISKARLLAAIDQYSPPALEIEQVIEERDFMLDADNAMGNRYLADLPRQLEAISNLAESQDLENLPAIAHNVEGAGSASGFAEVSRLGRALESAARPASVDNFQSR